MKEAEDKLRKDAADTLKSALNEYMADNNLADTKLLGLRGALIDMASDSSPAPDTKQFAEVCFNVFQAVQKKTGYEKFIDSFRAILKRDVPDEFFRIRMLSEIRDFPNKELAGKVEDLLWTPKDVEKQFQDIKEVLTKAGAAKLSTPLEQKFLEYKKTKKPEAAKPETDTVAEAKPQAVKSSAIKTEIKKFRPARMVALDSTGVEGAHQKAVVPKKPKAKKQPAATMNASTESAEIIEAPKEIESVEPYRVSKETEEIKSSRQKATMSQTSETVEISENPNKEKFRLAILSACSEFIRETDNKLYKDIFAKIVDHVTTSPISDSAQKLYEDIKKEGEGIKYFVDMLESNYEEFRQAPGEVTRERDKKAAELQAKRDADWLELQARVEAKGKKFEEKEKLNKREPTEEEIRISKEVHKQREDVKSLRVAIVKAKGNEKTLKVLEANFAEAEKNLVKLEMQLLVVSGGLQATPKLMELLEKRQAAEVPEPTLESTLEEPVIKAEPSVQAELAASLKDLARRLQEQNEMRKALEEADATLEGSPEKLKTELEQLQANRARQKASAPVPENAEEIEKALSEMRRNLEKTKKPDPEKLQAAKGKLKKWEAGKQESSDHKEMEIGVNRGDVVSHVGDATLEGSSQKEESMIWDDDMGEVSPSDIARLVREQVPKEKDEASAEDLLRQSKASMTGYEEAKAKANIPLMHGKEKLLKLVEIEFLQKREVLSQHTGLSEEDIETHVEAVASKGGHEALAQTWAKKWWDVLPTPISDFIAVRVFGLLPYDERVEEIKQHCVSTECNAELKKFRTDKKEHSGEYLLEKLSEGKFSSTIQSEVTTGFLQSLEKHWKREEDARKIQVLLEQKRAELDRVQSPPAGQQERKRPFGISFKVKLPKRSKNEEELPKMEDLDRQIDSMGAEEEKHQAHQREMRNMRTVLVEKSLPEYSPELKALLGGKEAEAFLTAVRGGLDYKLIAALGDGDSEKVIEAYDKYGTAKTEEEKTNVIKEALGGELIRGGKTTAAIKTYFEQRQQLDGLYRDFMRKKLGPAQRESLEGLKRYLKGIDNNLNLGQLHKFISLMDKDAAKNATKNSSTVPPPGHH